MTITFLIQENHPHQPKAKKNIVLHNPPAQRNDVIDIKINELNTFPV
jgi:hypothetical protein